MRFYLGEKVYLRSRNKGQVDQRAQTVVRIDTYRRFRSRPSTARYYLVEPLGEAVPEKDLYPEEGARRSGVSNESNSSLADARMNETVEHGSILDSTQQDEG